MSSFDYVIIGAGSAGCVLANRLSENGKYSVLLLEAGGSDRRFWIQVPIGYGRTYYQPAVNWMFMTEPQQGLLGRQSYWPRGKVLGGSSSINAMVYIRGHRKDYDDWAAQGNPGWGYQDVLPYFKKSESNSLGENYYRGGEGPLHVDDVTSQLHPLCKHFIESGNNLGVPYNPDFNAKYQEGIGHYQITTRNGFRMSAAKAYLHPVKSRKNLNIICRAHVKKILFQGRVATGVEYEYKGYTHIASAVKEVILSAGSINSPKLLQLSGIGDKALLKQHDLGLVYQNPAVGQNLQDHLGMDYLYTCTHPTLNDELNTWYGKLSAGIKYVLTRKGPLSLSVNQAGGFIRTQTGLEQPDIQLYFSPVSYTRAPPGKRPLMNPDPFSAFLLGVSNCRPTSRGSINIRSSNPFDNPEINPNYLTTDHDVSELLEGVKFLRRMADTAPLKNIILEEIRPGPSCRTEEQLIEDIRNYSWTVFHPTSTCRMGPNDDNAVVDSQLKVFGVEKLRVVDASVFPFLVSGNTNAPVIMVAEKGADLILQDA